LFAYQYAVAFTAALTFAGAPYNYGSVKVGLVLLSFGIGNLAGSVLGGRWSDRVLAQLKAKNGGESVPEVSSSTICAIDRGSNTIMKRCAYKAQSPL
jgi:MFS family permease